MANLQVMNLYDNVQGDKSQEFTKKLDSSLRIVTDYEKVDCNYDWLELMENSVRYIDNIFKNPNKFIVNEDDIIKIELARRVTVESIKHLSRNTNLIQDYDKKTGDVKPSKILNIRKEESYDTYENRVIYTLVQNMKFYISNKEKALSVSSSLKDYKKMKYQASTTVGKENVDIMTEMNTKIDTSKDGGKGGKSSNEEIRKRIDLLKVQINGLCNSDVYKAIDKLHITLVTPPIKKTNVVLKNPNFQQAMKLWDYLHAHVDDDISRNKDNKDYMDNGKLRDCFNETFLLNYLTACTLNNEPSQEVNKEAVSSKIVENMVEKLVDLNDIPLEQLQKLVGEKYQVVKYRNVVSDKKIQEIFRTNIDKYISKIDELKI